MIKIVTNEKLIANYQQQFTKGLREVCREKITTIVGYQGDSSPRTVYYSEKYNFWFTSQKNENRYWNAFGIGKPQNGRNTSITVEINPPYAGINRNTGGAFGHTKNGETLILHRGKIGGGRIGVGKQLFFDNYRDEPIIADDEGVENEFCLIGSLSSKYLPRQVANFISEVHRIKNLTVEETSEFSLLNDFAFTEEASGKSKVIRTGTTTIKRTHGIVVNTLAQILEDKEYKIGNDGNRDLYIHHRGKINKLFEFKTSCSTQDLYSAVGQLLIYSIPIKTKVDLIFVVPSEPSKLKKIVQKRLDQLGIQILYYHWNNDEPVFENMELIL